MASKKRQGPSQLTDLFLTVAEALGFETDRDVASLAQVVPDNVPNWRSGAVREFKLQTLEAVKRHLSAHIATLRQRAEAASSGLHGLHPVIIEEGSGPDELLRQFRDRVNFDYLGHRFLYYEPQGALAWLNLIQTGYDQSAWLRGAEEAAAAWFDTSADRGGRAKGPIAEALGLRRRGAPVGLDVVGLGCGDGCKEAAVLREALRVGSERLAWAGFAPVDVSIPLLLRAAAAGREVLGRAALAPGRGEILPFCADFEEGSLRFAERLRTSDAEGVRLVLLLGNVFGNLRDEDRFVRQHLHRLTRKGDLVWLEVATRLSPIESDPLFPMTRTDRHETAAEASRRMLLTGPFRRWEAALGRPPAPLSVRIWVREDDDAARVPGSCNFCHDLQIDDGRRVCTMLFSRRYDVGPLTEWLEERAFTVERIRSVEDSQHRPRVVHLLLRRR